jgi:hypothetical protein
MCSTTISNVCVETADATDYADGIRKIVWESIRVIRGIRGSDTNNQSNFHKANSRQ